VNELVLDASVVLKWFHHSGERHSAQARSLRAEYERGELLVRATPLLRLELINVAGRRWRWGQRALVRLARALDALGFELVEPELARVARWTARGLTAYDAAYVAVAEAAGVPLVTDDDLVLEVAARIAEPLRERG
jgi:predicted nucleic acid-binding protein